MKKTFAKPDCLPTIAAYVDENAKAVVAELSDNGEKPMNDFLSPLYTGEFFMAGSTDVGDVSWQTPTVQINTASFVSGSPGHSWQNVSCGKTSIAHKSVISAGKVLAASAIDLFENSEILAEAKREFEIATKSGYVCPIPADEYAKVVF